MNKHKKYRNLRDMIIDLDEKSSIEEVIETLYNDFSDYECVTEFIVFLKKEILYSERRKLILEKQKFKQKEREDLELYKKLKEKFEI